MEGRIRLWPLLAPLYLLMAWPTKADYLPFVEYLDADHSVLLKWGFDEVQGNITFRITVQTTGWVGFGLSPNGNMIGADMVIGGVGAQGIYFTDRHATGTFLPIIDSRQSYVLLSMTEIEGSTSMTFQRKLQTCDEEDFHITDKPIKLIYAYGDTDEIEYHSTHRGTKEVNLLNYMPRVTPQHRDYIDVTMDNLTLPAMKTHYHCRVRKMPRLNVTHHVYRVEPVIDNVDLVHHIILFACPAFVKDDHEGQCYSGNVADKCYTVMAACGPGAAGYELPEDVGIPIGGNNSDILYRLEIHYNNPTSEAGRRDSSGLRLYYTSELRRHTAGTLVTGAVITNDYKIPPGATQFHTYGTCNTSLFSEVLEDPVPDLHVFAVFLHTHLAGRKVRSGLFRGGKQVDFLSVNEHYDFNFQEMHKLGNIKTIKANDDILVECTYNTTGRKGYTQMGYATTDEMCVAFILYYPDIGVSSCWSYPNMDNVEKVPNVTQPADQEDINNYEHLLKTNEQKQFVSNFNGEIVMHLKGTVGNMKDTPTLSCRDNPPTMSTSPTTPSCSVTRGSALLLLLLMMLL